MAMSLTEKARLQRRAIRMAIATPILKAMLRPGNLTISDRIELTDAQRATLREHEAKIRRELLETYPAEQVNDALERALRLDAGAMVLKSMLERSRDMKFAYDDRPRRKAGGRPESGSQTLAREVLAEAHAARIVQALEHLGRGQDTLKVLLDQRAGPVGDSRGRPGGRDSAREQGEASPVNPVNLRETLVLGYKEADTLLGGRRFRDALIADAAEVFRHNVEARVEKTRKALADPNSAAYANVKELIAALVEGASELVDKSVHSKMLGRRT